MASLHTHVRFSPTDGLTLCGLSLGKYPGVQLVGTTEIPSCLKCRRHRRASNGVWR